MNTAKLRNIGPKSAAWLRQVGLRSREDLESVGAVDAFMPLLPAATTIVEPRATAPSIASCRNAGQAPWPPRLRLSTSAGVSLTGTPSTTPPDAHVIAAAMSEV